MSESRFFHHMTAHDQSKPAPGLHKLYHLRMCHRHEDSRMDVNVLLTAADDDAAKAAGLLCVSDEFREHYEVQRCEVVCMTPDEVNYYEPV